MADETSTAPATNVGLRGVILVFTFVAILLLAAITVVAITQIGSATASQNATIAVRLEVEQLKQAFDRVRQDAEAKDRLLGNLATRLDRLTAVTTGLQENSAKVADSVKALGQGGTRIQEDIATLRAETAPLRTQVERSGAVQQEITEKLTRLGERIETVGAEAARKEVQVLQGQVADTKGRLEQTEKDVAALRQAIHETELPSLKANVQRVDREVAQIEAGMKALSEASEALRAQVQDAFHQAFYNQPWGKQTPATPAP
jgi:chromosome segregation ATPase